MIISGNTSLEFILLIFFILATFDLQCVPALATVTEYLIKHKLKLLK